MSVRYRQQPHPRTVGCEHRGGHEYHDQAEERDWRYWAGLALCYLSADETARLHEQSAVFGAVGMEVLGHYVVRRRFPSSSAME